MKKVLCGMFVILSFAGSAFGAALDTHTPTTATGMSIRGGADATTAAAAASPLIKFSTGVLGLVNFTATANVSTGYVVATRHIQGSKYFATANDITNIYWKQAAKAADAAAAITAMGQDIDSSTTSSTVFAAGNGWTSY